MEDTDKKDLVLGAQAAANGFPVLVRPVDEFQDLIDNFGGSSAPWTPPKVEFPGVGGVNFTTHEVVGDEDHRELRVIILAAKDERSYYSRSIEESGQNSAPDCSSKGTGIGLGNPGGDCSLCELSKFGSAANGVSQACRLRRKLIFVRMGKRLPETINLTPTSVGPCSQYFTLLFNEGLTPDNVITRLSLRKEKNTRTNSFYPVAEFKCVEMLTAEHKAQIREIARLFRGFAQNSRGEDEVQ